MKKLFERILILTREYLITIILFMIAAVMGMTFIYDQTNPIGITDWFNKLLLVIIYGGVFSVFLKSILKRFKLSIIYNLLIPVIMLIVYYFLGDINNFTAGIKFGILNLATVLAYFSIPFIDNKNDSYYFTYKVLIALALTIITYIILLIGINLTVVSVSLLFEFKLPEYIYPWIIVFILGFICPTVFLLLIPNNELEKGAYPKFVLRVVSYAVVPILTVYTVILYAYLIKILIQFEIPANTLANLVIYYALISIFVLYFGRNVKFEYNFVNKFMKYYQCFLVIPVLVMIYSFVIRIINYGVTEVRYYAILVAIFVLGANLLMRTLKSVKYIPMYLAVLLLLSIMPFVSSYEVSSASQEQQLRTVLTNNKMLKDNQITPKSNILEKDQRRIIDLLYYFSDRNELNRLEFLPDNFQIKNIEKVFGFSGYSLEIVE